MPVTGAAERQGGAFEAAVPAQRQQAFREVALLLARHEIRNLRRWFDEFDHDILLPILLGEIALHNVGAFENGGQAAGYRLDGDVPCQLKPCNAYSIAAATGLPRETVRRKIGHLVALGWIHKRRNGHLFVTAEAIRHFGALLGTRQLSETLAVADRSRRILAR